MQYRMLGQTDIAISTVGMGFWAVADPVMWGAQDEHDAIAAVHAALDLGMNFFDTAEAYGDGTSEELLGYALGDRRDEAIIASKVSPQHLAPDDLIAACEASLRRLNTDYLDLYQIHWPNHDIPLADSFDALERLREQGKIRAIGVSNFGLGDLYDTVEVARIETNQLPYSLLFRAIENTIMPLCAENGIGVLAYSPLLHGLLSGKYASPDDLPPERQRTRHFSATRPQARHGEPGAEAELAAALDAIRTIADQCNMTMAQLALAWVAHQPGVTSVIAGMRNPQQVEQNAIASDIMLDGETIVALNRATAGLKAALGPNPDMWQGYMESRYC